MTSTRTTFEEYRALSAEERELIRLGEALAFAEGELEPSVVKRSRRKNSAVREANDPILSKAELVAAIADGADLDFAQARRALEALTTVISGTGGLAHPTFGQHGAIAARQKDMDALVEANKAAAAGYQDLFEKQIAIFEKTMAEAQKQLRSIAVSKVDDRAKAQAELARAAFEKALANMQALAESAQKANAEAFVIVSARIKESLEELGATVRNTTHNRQ